jgi:flagellar basal-body rod protein FlgF
MDNAIHVALSRLIAETRSVDVTAANLANTTTPGYRAERVVFSDWLSRRHGAVAGTVVYAQDRATYRERQAGQLTHTGNPLDLALSGEGFFTVLGANGPRLTRAGRFSLANNGTVIDAEGDALLDTTGKKIQITTADTHISVAADGVISSENGQIGHIGVVTAADPNQLQGEGARLLNAGATATTQVGRPHIVEGAVEESNVQPTLEVTRLMNGLRTFQMLTQFVQTEADREQNAITHITQANH